MTDSIIKRQELQPQVSIIVNCYNGERYLQDSLESAINQKYKNWELIFWDNRSIDRSAEIFFQYKDKRLKYYMAEKFTSLGEARNLAISKACGKWLAFMDCDDVWHTSKLQLQIAAIDEASDNNIGFVYGLYNIKVENEVMNNKMVHYYSRLKLTPHGPTDLFSSLMSENFIIFSSVLMSNHLYHVVGGIDSRLSQNEDYDLLLKLSLHSKAICIDAICVLYRIHEKNNSQTNTKLSYLEFDLIYRSLPDSLEKNNAIKKNNTRYGIFLLRNCNFYEGGRLILKGTGIKWIIKRIIYHIGNFFKYYSKNIR
jgi:glycosyltransferase involved in cell wall biosynthesis